MTLLVMAKSVHSHGPKAKAIESKPLTRAIRSYDVFDTVITRIVGEPTSVFLLAGHAAVAQVLWSGTAEQFALARGSAESRARHHSAPYEVTFAHIYRELARSYDLSVLQVGRLAEVELATERKLIRAVPAVARELERVRGAGYTVGFISDMYLSHDVLYAWLEELGVLHSGEALWVSSEHGLTKYGGGMYDAVLAAHPHAAGDWVHKGDNEYADVRPAAQRGIGTDHYVECHLNPCERLMERAATETCGLSSLFAGASRWTRLNRPADTDVALNQVAAGVAAPLVYSFVLWILLESKRRGLTRLWFMARDGQVMLPVARKIADRLGLDIELGYLYAGRQVVRVASLTAVDDAALEWMTGGSGVMTLQAVLDRVGLPLAAAQHVATAVGLPSAGPIGWSRVALLKDFLRHPEVEALILKEAAARRVVVLDYFRSCGLMGDNACAVVDIGWRGNVLRSIVDLIGEAQASKHTFMYFGLYAHPKNCDAVPKVAYLFDVDGAQRVGTGDDIPSLTTLMEIFCQADHGSVMALERRSGEFAPVCREPESSASRWDIPKFQAAVVAFANTVPINEFTFTGVDLRGVCDRLLRRLATSPSRDEVALLAPLGFVDDQGGSEPQPFAHSYGWQQVRVAYRTGNARPGLGLNWWAAGAASLTPKPIMWAMRLAAKVGRKQIERRAATPPAT